MYSSAKHHHGDAHGWSPKPHSNMVASNVSSNHGPRATISLDSVGGIHEEGWFPVTNTRSYGEAALHPLVHEAKAWIKSFVKEVSGILVTRAACALEEPTKDDPVTMTGTHAAWIPTLRNHDMYRQPVEFCLPTT